MSVASDRFESEVARVIRLGRIAEVTKSQRNGVFVLRDGDPQS